VTASLEITMDALDAGPVAEWWAKALGFEPLYRRDPYVVIGPPHGDPRPRLVIQRVATMPRAVSSVHLDLRVDEPDTEVARLVDLGASIEWTVDESSEGFIRWTTMADPWGTLFCVCPAREPRGDDAAS
jgi:hypothetical protein